MQRDDQQIFHQAIDELQVKLIRYAKKFVGDEEVAKEMVQETFLRLWKEPPRKVAKHITPWLFFVCRNLCIERQRKVARMNPQSVQTWQLVDERSLENNPFEQVATKNRFAHAQKLIEKLPKKQQEVIILKFQNGFSYKQIALITGMSVTHVGKTIHDIMSGLRQEMSKMENTATSKGGAQ